ncbi:unnamed protein product [Closterium sp. NIES-54]
MAGVKRARRAAASSRSPSPEMDVLYYNLLLAALRARQEAGIAYYGAFVADLEPVPPDLYAHWVPPPGSFAVQRADGDDDERGAEDEDAAGRDGADDTDADAGEHAGSDGEGGADDASAEAVVARRGPGRPRSARSRPGASAGGAAAGGESGGAAASEEAMMPAWLKELIAADRERAAQQQQGGEQGGADEQQQGAEGLSFPVVDSNMIRGSFPAAVAAVRFLERARRRLGGLPGRTGEVEMGGGVGGEGEKWKDRLAEEMMTSALGVKGTLGSREGGRGREGGGEKIERWTPNEDAILLAIKTRWLNYLKGLFRRHRWCTSALAPPLSKEAAALLPPPPSPPPTPPPAPAPSTSAATEAVSAEARASTPPPSATAAAAASAPLAPRPHLSLPLPASATPPPSAPPPPAPVAAAGSQGAAGRALLSMPAVPPAGAAADGGAGRAGGTVGAAPGAAPGAASGGAGGGVATSGVGVTPTKRSRSQSSRPPAATPTVPMAAHGGQEEGGGEVDAGGEEERVRRHERYLTCLMLRAEKGPPPHSLAATHELYCFACKSSEGQLSPCYWSDEAVEATAAEWGGGGGAVVGLIPRFIGGAGLRMCCDNIDRGLSGVKASWKRTGVTVASDMMTDKNGRPQANVFLVNDSGAVFKDSVDCRMETKTGGYVASILRPVVEEVGPENVVAFCTDDGSNYAVACNQLIAEWPHIQHVPCATHVLDLFMEDVGKMPWAKNVVDPAGDISSFVRNHHWTRGYLRNPEMVGARMLQALKPAGTRFGTQYIVVSRLCELRQSLAQMVVSDVWKGWAVGERKKPAEKFAAQVLDDAWWKTAEFFCKLMKLPFFAMRNTDADAKGMMGRMYDTMLQLTEDVGTVVEEDEEQLSYSDKVHIRRLLKNRWDGSLACPMHVAGRILNPANQDEDIFGSDAECTKVFKAFITQHAEHLCNHGKEGDGGDDFGEVLLELQEGVRAFLDMKGSFGMGDAIAQRSLVKEGKYDMVKWWQWHGTDAPKLAALAIRTLSQAVSASPCERGWSTWDGVHTARRNRLGSAKCRDLVFVAHNWNVVRNWHSCADVMPGVVLGNMPEPPMPEGYNVVEGDEEEEEEGDDVILEDEYE